MSIGQHGGIMGADGLPIDPHGGVRPGMPGGMGRIQIPKGMIEQLVKDVLSDLNILDQLAMIDARTKALLSHFGIPEPEIESAEKESTEHKETAQK